MTDPQPTHGTPDAAPEATRDAEPSGLKLAIELGPLLVFFGTYLGFGIYPATAVLMAATVASLAASRWLLGRISPMPVVTAVVVCVFGGLTFWLNDPSFIKMKPTIASTSCSRPCSAAGSPWDGRRSRCCSGSKSGSTRRVGESSLSGG